MFLLQACALGVEVDESFQRQVNFAHVGEGRRGAGRRCVISIQLDFGRTHQNAQDIDFLSHPVVGWLENQGDVFVGAQIVF